MNFWLHLHSPPTDVWYTDLLVSLSPTNDCSNTDAHLPHCSHVNMHYLSPRWYLAKKNSNIKTNASRSFVLLVLSLWKAIVNKTEVSMELINNPVFVHIIKWSGFECFFFFVQTFHFHVRDLSFNPEKCFMLHLMTLTQQDPEQERPSPLLSFLQFLML